MAKANQTKKKILKENKKTSKKFYITTAIDYPNSEPHCGHAYQKIIADVFTRWHKLLGEDVFYLTGTDEHGKKIQEAAEKNSLKPKEFVDKLADKFKEAWKALNIEYNRFIRTTDKDHEKFVQEVIEKCNKNGDVYLGKYEGLYCVPCEAYYTEKDLLEGNLCPFHKKPVEKLKEESYFFKLSKYQKFLLDLYKKHPEFVLPDERRNEIINRVKEGLKDLSISRTSFDWGIPFPLNKKHIVYCWFDALFNYVSGAGKNQEYWPANVHLLGKDNSWFHCVYWPAFLKSAGYKLPKTVFVHGFLTFNGQKISKSLGNVISPIYLAEKYGTDSIRYFICRHFVFGQDGDFSEQKLIDKNNSELADKLGNLVSRVTALAEKYGLEKAKTGNKLLNKLKLKEIEKEFQNFEIDKALSEVFSFIDECNLYVQEKKPWETHDKKILYELVDSIKSIAILLWPFIPETSEKIAKNLGFEIKYENINKSLEYKNIKKSEVLFKKIELENKEGTSLNFANYKSYLMGASKITDNELLKLGIKIKKEDGDRLLLIQNNQIENYLSLIENKLDKGFWNEVVGNNIIFIFKFKDGKIRRMELNSSSQLEIAKLCAEFNNQEYKETSDILGYLLDNSFYADYVTEIRKSKQEKTNIIKQNINKSEEIPKSKIEGVTTMSEIINYDQFSKVDLRVGTITKIEEIEGADKLLKLEVDLGKEIGKRTLCAGIKKHYTKEELKNKQIIVVCNLAPRMMKGIESKGMLLAAVSEDETKVILLSPEKKIENGSKVQ